MNDWASAADTRPILLFEAIGGQGKSMLTWEWTKNYAPQVRNDWAGFFWYSFYEQGAVMADFCQRALAYITGQPLETFRKKKTRELGDLLVSELQKRPWLLVLDGLERILVAYHRFDAAHIMDEEVDSSSDQMSKRNPCSAIRTEDDELLDALRRASPSKLLITSRLTPQTFINRAQQNVPEVLREFLPGLRPEDAESLFRASGVTGDSRAIQDYLQSSCACHPLVIGVLAGIINNYPRDPGNFDTWVSNYGGANLLSLTGQDLIQKRTHILQLAIDDLSETSRQLLSILAIIPGAITGQTLEVFNPHIPPEIEEYTPSKLLIWEDLIGTRKPVPLESSEQELERRRKYDQAVKERKQIVQLASQKLYETVLDLRRRGLLQFDFQTRHYDLHPVVRGFATNILQQDEKERYGLRVVDHFSQQNHIPYEQVKHLEQISLPLYVIRVLLIIGNYGQAFSAYQELSDTLINLEADAEILSLLRPYFPYGWTNLPDMVDSDKAPLIGSEVAAALEKIGKWVESVEAYNVVINADLKSRYWTNLTVHLMDISRTYSNSDRIAAAERILSYAEELASIMELENMHYHVRLRSFWGLILRGHYADAEDVWNLIDARDKEDSYFAQYCYVEFCFQKGNLREEHLTKAIELANENNAHFHIRHLYWTYGRWQSENGLWALATKSFRKSVHMARESGKDSTCEEAWLLLSQFHSGQTLNPDTWSERLNSDESWTQLALAKLCLAMRDLEKAKVHALKAYEFAQADGEPYVKRASLNRAIALMDELNVPIPPLKSYDPAKDIKHDWEDAVKVAIKELREEKNKEK